MYPSCTPDLQVGVVVVGHRMTTRQMLVSFLALEHNFVLHSALLAGLCVESTVVPGLLLVRAFTACCIQPAPCRVMLGRSSMPAFLLLLFKLLLPGSPFNGDSLLFLPLQGVFKKALGISSQCTGAVLIAVCLKWTK